MFAKTGGDITHIVHRLVEGIEGDLFAHIVANARQAGKIQVRTDVVEYDPSESDGAIRGKPEWAAIGAGLPRHGQRAEESAADQPAPRSTHRQNVVRGKSVAGRVNL